MTNGISVQAFATQRNGQAELLVDFLLNFVLKQMKNSGELQSFADPQLQKQFKTDTCSDVFDHYFTVQLDSGDPIQFWCQTTCYKGNEVSAPEPNKTYEIRETLIEGLGLRATLKEKGVNFRTVHFTLGPTSYTYSWFPAAKDNAYDLSLYLPSKVNGKDVFDFIATTLQGVTTEFEVKARLQKAYDEKLERFDEFVSESVQPITQWFEDGLKIQPMADSQADLLIDEHAAQVSTIDEVIESSKSGGENIKGEALKLLRGEEVVDPVLATTLEKLLAGNPFLNNAIQALADWVGWLSDNVTEPSSNIALGEYIKSLWNEPLPKRLVVRRLLVRMNTGEAVRYPADLQISGITEHNLYNGNHLDEQVEQIANKLKIRYEAISILSAQDLYDAISRNGKKLLKDSLKLESYNGTSLKPSFLYVETALQADFDVVSFRDTKLPLPLAYYSQFGEFNVNPYSNMKVITSKKTGTPLAILKAKYFRRQEFPRRVKEESYVGLTTKYKLAADKFEHRYDVPLIMFVDMDTELVPPEYSVRRLATAGWEVFFSIDKLKEHLKGLEK